MKTWTPAEVADLKINDIVAYLNRLEMTCANFDFLLKDAVSRGYVADKFSQSFIETVKPTETK